MMIAESKTSDALFASGNVFVCRLHFHKLGYVLNLWNLLQREMR